jgi:GntR family transcriptional regulator of arabinose operon
MIDFNSLLPKYYQLKEHLKGLISSGEIAPGEQLPSETELVGQFRLSRHTVRKAFAELEHEGRIFREQGRGTFCSFREKGSGKAIAVITTYISNYIFPSIMRGIERTLSSAGYILILANTWNDTRKETQCLENILHQDISGLIIEPTKSAESRENRQYFAELDKRAIPYLFLHASYPDLEPAYVVMDDEAGGFMAAEYVLQMGHRRVAGIFKEDDLQGVRRQEGFLRAAEKFGLPAARDLVGNYDTERLFSFPYQYTRYVLQRDDPPTAIVCYNDEVAVKVMEAIRDAGREVPRDVSVIGYDNSHLAETCLPKLTSINHPKEEMGSRAAGLILDMVLGKADKPRFTYEPSLTVRSSCRQLSASGERETSS